MIKEWLNEYKPKNNLEAEQALREIMQEVALFGLQQSAFFEVAAFYGGTALRIFHGLPRFSEDLDFSLLSPMEEFSLQPYLDGMVEQLMTSKSPSWSRCRIVPERSAPWSVAIGGIDALQNIFD